MEDTNMEQNNTEHYDYSSVFCSGWKQPVPTNLHHIFGEDYRCTALFKELVFRSANNDGLVTVGKYTVYLKRGQVIYGRNRFGKYLCWDDNTTDRALIKLRIVYDLVSFDTPSNMLRRNRDKVETKASNQTSNLRGANFTVVTIKNYDLVVGMSKHLIDGRATNELPVSTSKSIKTIKSDIDEDFLKNLLDTFNEEVRTNYEMVPVENVGYWLKVYTPEQMLKAVRKIKFHPFWKDKMTPEKLFRIKSNNETVDRIGELLNTKTTAGEMSAPEGFREV